MKINNKDIIACIGITEKGEVVSDSPEHYKDFDAKDPALVIHTFLLWCLSNQQVASLFNASVEVDLQRAAMEATSRKYAREIEDFYDKLQSGEIKYHGSDLNWYECDDDDDPVYH
jgi:accessory colonization factor AcfC